MLGLQWRTWGPWLVVGGILFKQVIFRIHVSFQGCNSWRDRGPPTFSALKLQEYIEELNDFESYATRFSWNRWGMLYGRLRTNWVHLGTPKSWLGEGKCLLNIGILGIYVEEMWKNKYYPPIESPLIFVTVFSILFFLVIAVNGWDPGNKSWLGDPGPTACCAMHGLNKIMVKP